MSSELRRTKVWPSIDRIREVLEYNPATGVFTWCTRMSSRAEEGARAGTLDPRGYRQIRIDGVVMREHRLAWALVYGRWPCEQIDHIDGDPSNNRIENLREADGFQNHQNEKLQKNNKSGYAGVRWRAGKWEAFLIVYGRHVYCGRFSRIEDAIEARREAKRKHHQFQPFDRCDPARMAPEPRA